MLNTEFFTAGSELPPYLPYPRYLLKLNISMTAKAVYALLLNRTTLSQKNGWIDDCGRVYIIYTIERLAQDIGRGETAIKNAMKELEKEHLLYKKKVGFAQPNHLYVRCDFTRPESADEDDLPALRRFLAERTMGT